MDTRLVRRCVVLGLLLAAPSTASAQVDDDDARWFDGFPNFSIELYAGVATHGTFLRQALDDDGINPQRRLEADASFSFGGSLGFMFLPRTAARIAFTRTSTDLDYEDDTGTGSDDLDVSDLAELSSNVLSFEIIRHLLSERRTVSPYGGLGLALAWWNLDPGDPALLVGGDGDTEMRYGGVAILGMQFRPSSRFAIRAEVTGFGLGNPFTGNESFVPVTGFTMDEPDVVTQKHFRLTGVYTFSDRERPRPRRRRR